MPAYVSSARAFFDDLKSRPDPFAYLSGLPTLPDPFFEEEWIDFKSQPQNDTDARKIWSKALSGYANLTDGLIVWGIDARKRPPRNIDAASGLSLVVDPHAFESSLRDWIRDATNPPVMGVEYRSYSGPTGEGFVVCLVPQSEHKPHRAEWAGRHYYYRAGDDFLVAEPAMLRLLFYPRYNPRFEIKVRLGYTNKQIPHQTITAMKLWADIANTGNESAEDVCVVLTSNAYDIFGEVLPNSWLVPGANWRTIDIVPSKFMALATIPLHPGFWLRFMVSQEWKARQRHLTTPGNTLRPIRPEFIDIEIHFDVYSKNTSHKSFAVKFSQDDLLEGDECIKSCDPLDG